MPQLVEADIAIIGTGAGGGTLAYALKDSGARVVLLERGGFLPSEPANWSPGAVFGEQRYKTHELWRDGDGRPFRPGMQYFVGGNTKVYGAALARMRREDFAEYRLEDGISPAWPIGYDDLEPYYERAEAIYRVHGTTGEDPTEPPRSSPYPFPPVPDEPVIAGLRARLRAQGLHPYSLPLGIDLREDGTCIRCGTCDGFPCRIGAKSDADLRCVRPAIASDHITLRTETHVERLATAGEGTTVTTAECRTPEGPLHVKARTFVVACGAVNSAALLLRSANGAHPNGLANGSGQVGRNYMGHVHTSILALGPRRNTTTFQKTLAVNDYYHGDADWAYPLGTLWLIGKVRAPMLRAAMRGLPAPVARAVAARSVDWWACSEDVPSPDRRVTLDQDGTIRVSWRPTNLHSHRRLVALGKRMLRRAGYPVVLHRHMGPEFNAHQCGTARFGTDPRASVLDPLCRAHDVENLFVVDASFFPSSAVLNPVLTIAAQALRVADKALT
jgi:choline dehydrogenase-like flavoprotein